MGRTNTASKMLGSSRQRGTGLESPQRTSPKPAPKFRFSVDSRCILQPCPRQSDSPRSVSDSDRNSFFVGRAGTERLRIGESPSSIIPLSRRLIACEVFAPVASMFPRNRTICPAIATAISSSNVSVSAGVPNLAAVPIRIQKHPNLVFRWRQIGDLGRLPARPTR